MDSLKSKLLSRLTCSISYSAYEAIRSAIAPSTLAGLVPLFACGTLFFKTVEGLHILCAILAAQVCCRCLLLLLLAAAAVAR
jgi:hypothetical protein